MPDESEPGSVLSKHALVVRFWDDRRSFLGHAYRSLYDHDRSLDIFQEACARFLASNADFHCYEAAASYLHRIIRSLIVDWRRKNQWLLFPGALPEMVCELESKWNDQILFGKLRKATRMLSGKDQKVLAAYASADLPNLTARSRAVNLPISTFRYQAKRAVRRVRKLMNIKPVPGIGFHSTKGEQSHELASS